jgi:hypothetical protein
MDISIAPPKEKEEAKHHSSSLNFLDIRVINKVTLISSPISFFSGIHKVRNFY